MPPRNKKRKSVRPGILIAAEGYVETAFLCVLREYYAVPNYKVTIDNRRGGSSDTTVRYACNEANGYFKTSAVIDSDVPLSDRLRRLADRNNVNIIISTPAIEGTLLKVLEIPHGEITDDCKKQFQSIVGEGKATFKQAHKRIFTEEVISNAVERVPELAAMINAIRGNS